MRDLYFSVAVAVVVVVDVLVLVACPKKTVQSHYISLTQSVCCVSVLDLAAEGNIITLCCNRLTRSVLANVQKATTPATVHWQASRAMATINNNLPGHNRALNSANKTIINLYISPVFIV